MATTTSSRQATQTVLTTTQAIQGTQSSATLPVPRRLLVWLTAGIGGTALFMIIYLIEGVTRPGYSAWSQTISSLSFGQGGWIQQANFILCGVSCLVLAYAWRQVLKGGVCATWYPVLKLIEGVGLIGLGIFREDPLHTISMVITMIAMCASLIVISRRFWGDPKWRGWAMFSIACGVWPNLVMPLFGLALNPQGPLSSYTGLIERLATSPDIAWGVVLLIPLWMGRELMLRRNA